MQFVANGSDGDVVALAVLHPEDWDNVYSFSSYSTPAHIERVLGQSFDYGPRKGPFNEDSMLFVFLKNGKIVSVFEQGAPDIHLSHKQETYEVPVSRSKAKIKIVHAKPFPLIRLVKD